MLNLNGRIWRGLLVLAVAGLNVLIIAHPTVALEAAGRGLFLWFNSVLPGILPFVIGANVLAALGAVNVLGLLLNPVMKWVFRVGGRGGFALAMGLVSGYPVGAKIVCEMRGRGELGKTEAQRLLGFANNGGPLFILGAVAAGMFGSVVLGYLLLATHYLGAIVIGLVMRLYGKRKGDGAEAGQTPIITMQPRGAFGQILGKAVSNAMETLLLVGGFIVLFSVVSALLNQVGLFGILADFVPMDGDYAPAVLTGIVEMTGGLGALSEFGINGAIGALAAFLLGFGGLSIMFQSLSFIGKTDLSSGIYILCKLGHGALSAFITWMVYPLFTKSIEESVAIAVFAPTPTRVLASSATHFALVVVGLVVLCLAILTFRTLRRDQG
ncbi:MAG: sporulation integral membrane protein YlbJ [Defluviitaleaceae bacterium]|nr:sporulation integral membrane protein YlbJ [Defluviitaleaceae bacterium]